MKAKIKKNYKRSSVGILIIGIIVLILITGTIIYKISYNILSFINNFSSKEVLVEEIVSPDDKHTLKVYYINNGAITGDSLKVKLVNNKTNKARDIYVDYPVYYTNLEEQIKIKWIDNEIIEINEIKLNINEDNYDWRKNR